MLGKIVVLVALCAVTINAVCLDGEVTFGDSCYVYNRTARMNWEEGVKFCGSNNMIMFSPNSIQELKTVLYHALAPGFTWLGATGKEINLDEASITLTWVDGEGMNVTELPWAVNTDSKGLTAAARCLAFYNSGVASVTDKVNFVPCSTPTNVVICERKAIDLPKKMEHTEA